MMISIYSSFEMASSLEVLADVTLVHLIVRRHGQIVEDGVDLAQMGGFIVVQTGDAAALVERALGFSPLVTFVDGVPYGHPDFVPSWEWSEDHGGWFELVFIFTDDGFAHVLFVPDDEGVDADLLAMCREHCRRPAEKSAVDPPPDLIDPTEL